MAQVTPLLLGLCVLGAGCSSSGDADAQPAGAAPTARAAETSQQAAPSAAQRPEARANGPFAARRGELANPDDSTLVLLYHDLAGIAVPLDLWADEDQRVRQATGAQRAARRAEARAELEAALRAVQDIGTLRLALNDRLSEYDPEYGEYTLRALAPSSSVSYRAWNRQVGLRFGNGRHAQTWRVDATEAATVEDSFRFGRDVVLDVLLQITGVEPGPAGGTLVADVVELELRTQQGNRLLARLAPPRQ